MNENYNTHLVSFFANQQYIRDSKSNDITETLYTTSTNSYTLEMRLIWCSHNGMCCDFVVITLTDMLNKNVVYSLEIESPNTVSSRNNTLFISSKDLQIELHKQNNGIPTIMSTVNLHETA